MRLLTKITFLPLLLLLGNAAVAQNAPFGTPGDIAFGDALVGKGPGYITCHNNAPGGDMVYLNDRY